MPLYRRPLVCRTIVVLVVVWQLSGLTWAVVASTVESGWYGLAASLALAVTAGAACVAAFAKHVPGRNAALLAVATACGLALHGLNPYSGSGIIYLVPWLAAFRTRLWQAAALGLVAAAGFLLVSIGSGLGDWEAIGSSLGLLYFALFAVLIRQILVAREQTEVVAKAQAREAVLAERQRLAREIHDVLAHSLSAQIVHLEGARLLLERGADPAEALDRVTSAGQLARAGLDETRWALDTLRGDELPLAERLDRLAAEFSSATGASCRVTVSGDPAGLPPECRLAVVRTAQEALTNVRKHAPGAGVTVALRRVGGWCELDVQDTGGGPGELGELGGGYGLVGMRERAELLGGSLDASPDGAGFRVLLRVPA